MTYSILNTTRGTPCVIWDLDGVLADSAHRFKYITERKDWSMFHSLTMRDKVIAGNVPMFKALRDNVGWAPIICTSRDERGRALSELWLKKHGFTGLHAMMMRKAEDGRSSVELKRLFLSLIQGAGFVVRYAFEDQPEIVSMYRNCGVPCWAAEDCGMASIDSRIVNVLQQETV